MSTHHDRLKRIPDTFRQLTGITPAAFDPLLAQLAPRYAEADARLKNRLGRQCRPGAGRKHALVLGDRLLMLLIDDRTCVTHAFLGFLFGIDDSAGRTINPLQPLLAGIFRIPGRKVTLQPDEIQELFFDATEQPRDRPQKQQKRWYSGKKKRQTLKTQVVVVRRRRRTGRRKAGPAEKRRVRIAAVSPTHQGRVHDKKGYDRTRTMIPPGVAAIGDTGYQGTSLETPETKKPKQPLTKQQRKRKRRLGGKRIVVEHGIGKLKIWRIASERYRNPTRRHPLIMKNIAGLHNLMDA